MQGGGTISADLRLVVDGITYQNQTHGGISPLYNEILRRMCDLDDSLGITLLTEGNLRQALPEHAGITHPVVLSAWRYLRPGRVWNPALPSIRRPSQDLNAYRSRSKPTVWIGTLRMAQLSIVAWSIRSNRTFTYRLKPGM